MRKLVISPRLQQEFATVEALWHSSAETRRVDSLILAWVKYEKQLRRLFCFLVFQHPHITSDKIDSVIAAMARNRSLYPRTFILGIAELKVDPIPALIGGKYPVLRSEIEKVKRYRDKLIHGQITGLNVSSPQLEGGVVAIVEWISSLAEAAEMRWGYDGLRRNTYRSAKSVAQINVAEYPFKTVAEFEQWLAAVAKKAIGKH